MAAFALLEIPGDLFAAAAHVSLAHCVAQDMKLGKVEHMLPTKRLLAGPRV